MRLKVLADESGGDGLATEHQHLSARCGGSVRLVVQMNTPYQSLSVAEELQWWDFAACKGTDIRLFYPETTNDRAHQAKALCSECPVKKTCLDWAIDNWEHGIWGGMTYKERRAERRRRRLEGESVSPPPLQPIQHGTPAGYSLHVKRKIPSCDECRQAYQDRRRERKAAKQRAS